ncbi:GntR family transcriptional regulator [Actinomadura meyerae]|uniref:GntR family transcriptional regulator n=1 Tax=Actinomadura meyerae TaxID=240840 RepID=UPI0015C653A7|nr:winged helix-turn-helix domain-containing protein [Actinomadura meyerae]
MRFDLDQPRAAYLVIADELERAIRDGEIPAGTRVPSARRLADMAGVSTRTSEAALRVLKERQVTVSVHGKGTYPHPNLSSAAQGDGQEKSPDQSED